jgi:hypothetical protein
MHSVLCPRCMALFIEWRPEIPRRKKSQSGEVSLKIESIYKKTIIIAKKRTMRYIEFMTQLTLNNEFTTMIKENSDSLIVLNNNQAGVAALKMAGMNSEFLKLLAVPKEDSIIEGAFINEQASPKDLRRGKKIFEGKLPADELKKLSKSEIQKLKSDVAFIALTRWADKNGLIKDIISSNEILLINNNRIIKSNYIGDVIDKKISNGLPLSIIKVYKHLVRKESFKANDYHVTDVQDYEYEFELYLPGEMSIESLAVGPVSRVHFLAEYGLESRRNFAKLEIESDAHNFFNRQFNIDEDDLVIGCFDIQETLEYMKHIHHLSGADLAKVAIAISKQIKERETKKDPYKHIEDDLSLDQLKYLQQYLYFFNKGIDKDEYFINDW